MSEQERKSLAFIMYLLGLLQVIALALLTWVSLSIVELKVDASIGSEQRSAINRDVQDLYRISREQQHRIDSMERE